MGYARLYDGTLVIDYYAAMGAVEQSLEGEVDGRHVARSEFESLIAIVDRLQGDGLTETQSKRASEIRDALYPCQYRLIHWRD